MQNTAEERSLPLISMTGAPLVWAAHFVVLYAVAGTACQKLAGPEAIWMVQWVTASATVLALAAIGWVVWYSAVRLQGDATGRFMARVTLMLAVLSAVAVIFSALPAILSASCQ